MNQIRTIIKCLTLTLIIILSFNLTTPIYSESLQYGRLYPIEIDGQYGYINSDGRVIVEPQFSRASDFSEGLAVVVDSDGHARFLNEQGEYALSSSFEMANNFQEGIAATWQQDDNGQFILSFINRQGQILHAHDSTFVTNGYSDGVAVIMDMYGDSDTLLIDQSGNVILQTKHRPTITDSLKFTEGYSAIYEDGAYFFINKKGEDVFDKRFEDAFNYSESLAAVGIIGKYGITRYGFINHDGNMVIEPEYYDAGWFNEGMAAVKNVLGLWGFIDKKGDLAIPTKYNEVKLFSEGLAAVRVGKLWGFIDRSGRQIIKPQFTEVSNFNGELAQFYRSTDDSDNQIVGYLNKLGKVVWTNKDSSSE